jgi:hypothetical protein
MIKSRVATAARETSNGVKFDDSPSINMRLSKEKKKNG